MTANWSQLILSERRVLQKALLRGARGLLNLRSALDAVSEQLMREAWRYFRVASFYMPFSAIVFLLPWLHGGFGDGFV